MGILRPKCNHCAGRCDIQADSSQLYIGVNCDLSDESMKLVAYDVGLYHNKRVSLYTTHSRLWGCLFVTWKLFRRSLHTLYNEQFARYHPYTLSSMYRPTDGMLFFMLTEEYCIGHLQLYHESTRLVTALAQQTKLSDVDAAMDAL